ncbi:MAG: hypothetical protein E7324_00255 [Clostridiales bacterium]|nr:hypothetical protein [Clostridiales bacterium]
MKKGLLLVLALMLLTSSCAFAQEYEALPTVSITQFKDRFYKNTDGLSGLGDPQIYVEGDTYYLIATGLVARGFSLIASDKVDAWKENSSNRKWVFKGNEWADMNYWAPELHKYGDQYVLMYSAQYGPEYNLRLGIAFADSPMGPFKDPLGKPLLDTDYCAIDAHLFVDDDGTPYLFYVRDNYDNVIGNHKVSQTYGVQLTPDLLSTVGEPVLLTTPSEDWELKSGYYIWNEGVCVLKHEGKYYLFFSANYTSTHDYCVGAAVSDHPLGPYVKQENNPILAPEVDLANGSVIVSGPGHHSYFTVGDELFASYHVNTSNTRPTMDRKQYIDRAGFHADGTAYINGVSLVRQLLPLADIGLANGTKNAFVSSDGETGLLTDGDYCIAASSAAYLWQGTECTLSWDEPITSDMVLIYPQRGEPGTGRIIINETYVHQVNLKTIGTLPGSFVLIGFEPMEISSIRIEWDQDTKIGEVIVLQNP